MQYAVICHNSPHVLVCSSEHLLDVAKEPLNGKEGHISGPQTQEGCIVGPKCGREKSVVA